MRRHAKASLARSHKPTGRGALGLTCICLLALAAIAGPVSVAAAEPPPGRAYELVSPIDDPSGAYAGLTTDLFPSPGMASDDGDRFLYQAVAGLDSPWSGPTNPMIFGRRTPTGWKAQTATVSIDHGNTPQVLGGSEAAWGWLTPDGASYVFWGYNLGVAPVAPNQYLPGVYRSTDDGSAPEWLTRPIDGVAPQPVGGGSGGGNFVQTIAFANRDTSVVALESKAPLSAEAPSAPTPAVYASRAGQLELVSKLPGGAAATEESSLVCSTVQRPAPTTRSCSALAGDGRFVLFRVGGAKSTSRSLYVRDLQQQVTRQLSGPALGLAEAELVAAPRDGARAYFKPLNGPYYEANLEDGTSTVQPAINGKPVGLSPDGRKMLFLEAPAAGAEDWTLRYWDDSSPGVSVEVGSLGASFTLTKTFEKVRAWVYRSLDEGRTWIFTAAGSLDPARPNATPSTQQLYRWSVGDSAPTCLSCEPVDGVGRSSGVNLNVQEMVATELMTSPTVMTDAGTGLSFSARKFAQPGHAISNDGRLILFDSPDKLVAEDTNGIRDVYLWDGNGAQGQQLQLVTSGKGNTPSYALDIDPTGRNLFFSTREGLVPADRNGNYNVYDARVGGGFPESGESCAGEACRPPVIPPLPAAIGSGTLGDGNARTSRGPAKPSIELVRARATGGSVAKLRVHVSGPGRLAVSGPMVRAAGRKVSRAGTYPVTVRPNARAKKALANKKSLKVRARVSYRAKDGRSVAKTVTVTFEAKTAAGKGR